VKIKQRVAALLTAALVGAGVAVAVAAPAHAGDYLHRIVNYNTGLCLEVPHSSMQMGEQLTVNICGPTSGSWNQKFWFSDGAFSNMYFVRPGHNLWCTAPGVASLYRSTIIQWGCDWSSFVEQWNLEPGPAGLPNTFKLRNAYSNECLTEEDPGLGTYVRQTTNCAEGFGSGASLWYLPWA